MGEIKEAEVEEVEASEVDPKDEGVNGALDTQRRVGPEQFGFDRDNIEIDDDAQDALSRSFDYADLEENDYNKIPGPDGQKRPMVYAPWHLLADRLDEAFGMGNWKLLPYESPAWDEGSGEIAWPGVLIVDGSVVTSSIGSEEWKKGSRMKKADAYESAKSDCLRKCCKPIMPALRELWKTSFQYDYWNIGERNETIDEKEGNVIETLAHDRKHPENDQTGEELINTICEGFGVDELTELTKADADKAKERLKDFPQVEGDE